MAGKSKPLRGRSELIRPDGAVVPVRDWDGSLVIEPQAWDETRARIAGAIGRAASEIVTAHPERRQAYGLAEGRAQATVILAELLGKEKAPAGAGTTDGR